ncbi:type III polyketide synthase [Candidatus Protochlamydia phocaeensis]|uniref:type III polyketide synthase n=1 Tax=Candidatus Protochlamydia phocaeensis TaxID=1414722 RepID=UPI0008383F4B|nr:type III polyketide synthase [Candidatus Protochlamydia phocaeensis]
MKAWILGLATTVPPYQYSQEEAAEKFIHILSPPEDKEQFIRKMYQNSAIQTRHSVVNDFKKEREGWHFWGSDYPKNAPGMSERNEMYKKEAPKLACEAAKKALQSWGGDPSLITHVISVSCTGVVAPGIEFDLIRLVGLKPTVNRLGINFMGCFGAFKGLSVAQAFAKENPAHRILVVCTELCSLHLQSDLDLETLTANALFADGAAAAVIGIHPHPQETPLWEIVNTHSMGLEKSLDKMSWEASDQGFLIRLSHTVPVLIGKSIKAFVQELLPSDLNYYTCDWAIHPGGKSILQAVEKAMQLNEDQTRASWEILADYGNMSSATFLFILERLIAQPKQKPWSVGLAFGPGLSIEGMLLRRPIERE